MGYYETIQTEKEMGNPAVRMGDKHPGVKRIQEWINLGGKTVVTLDGDFGPASLRALDITLGRPHADIPIGKPVMDEDEWRKLIAPYRLALIQVDDPLPGKLSDSVRHAAKAHLAVHAREVGGQNKGPWVRTYMRGNEGRPWPWCAGFVSFIMHQAATEICEESPLTYSFSSSQIAAEASSKGLLYPGEQVADPRMGAPINDRTFCIFLVKGGGTGYQHIGFAYHFNGDTFETIEGNSNDDGSYEGYEICRRIRSLKGKDLILI